MLTKSHFKKFVACPNEFWLDHHFPQPKQELSLNDQLRREAGYEVEGFARTLPIFTQPSGYTVEYAKEFVFGELYAKADIVTVNEVSGAIDIYEVKSGTNPEKKYQVDLTFQCIVAEKAGFMVRGAYLVLLDNTYVFDGNLDIERLLKISDETEFVEQNKDSISQQIDLCAKILDQPEAEPSLLSYCKGSKLDCQFIRRHFEIPDYNVSHLFKSGSKKLNALLDAKVLHLTDIPADFAMTDREAAIVEVERSQSPFIDSETIRDEIDGLTYPLNFLDYESFNPAIPQFLHTKPYQQMVFQYSLHSIDERGGEMRHSYHLSRNDGRHPTEEIVERLYEDLNRKIGTVIIWSEGFEKSRNTEMGEMFPQYAPFLNELNDAVYDLRKVFSRRLYMHPDFRGRDSIKKVLPVLSDLTYEGMDIADGLTASIQWYHAATRRGTLDEREKTFADLEAYCKLDTLAMIVIFEHLRETCCQNRER